MPARRRVSKAIAVSRSRWNAASPSAVSSITWIRQLPVLGGTSDVCLEPGLLGGERTDLGSVLGDVRGGPCVQLAGSRDQRFVDGGLLCHQLVQAFGAKFENVLGFPDLAGEPILFGQESVAVGRCVLGLEAHVTLVSRRGAPGVEIVAAEWADNELDVDEPLVGDDRLGQSRRLGLKLAVQVAQIVELAAKLRDLAGDLISSIPQGQALSPLVADLRDGDRVDCLRGFMSSHVGEFYFTLSDERG